MKELSFILATLPWIIIIGGWNSVYVHRVIGTFLLARADSIESKRIRMSTSLSAWKEKVGLEN